jgi:uncharacterized protein (DUF2147 family)
MTQVKMFFSFLLIVISTQIFAQIPQDKFLGKWLTKDKATVEVTKVGNSYSIKQIDAVTEKDKKEDGKIIGKDIQRETEIQYKGLVIDPSNGKDYKATWIISSNGKNVELKVKWGFINFNETWSKL